MSLNKDQLLYEFCDLIGRVQVEPDQLDRRTVQGTQRAADRA